MKKKVLTAVFILFSSTFFSCKKDWLDAKPNQAIAVPETLKDLQLLLNNTGVFNYDLSALHEASTDGHFVIDANYDTRVPALQNIYKWATSQNLSGSGKDFYDGVAMPDWNLAYIQIFYANLIWEQVNKITRDGSNQDEWDNILGSALFYRANTFFTLAQIFAKPYVEGTATTDPGVILRLSSNINELSNRATIKETYDRILADLHEAKALLPQTPPGGIKTKPSQHAAYALLARVYISMEKYSEALNWAEKALTVSNVLIDYNNYPPTAPSSPNPPFPKYTNPEVIFHTIMTGNALIPIRTTLGRIDTSLLNRYNAVTDLRRTRFFANTGSGASLRTIFRGSYGGSVPLFAGLATDEMFLIKAECIARAGDHVTAMQVLNQLYVKRWNNTVPFVQLSAANAEEALWQVLQERRKELCYRGLRWTDLRRLNRDPRFVIEPTRTIHGTLYKLVPNSNQYVYPIPDNEVSRSGVPQNPR